MSDEKLDLLLSDLRMATPDQYALVQEVRKLVKAVVPGASEKVMYGGILFAGPDQFCGVFAYTEHVSIEFGRGCDLEDIHQVLEGKGKFRRHIKIQSPADIKAKHLRSYIEQAYQKSGDA